MLQNASKIYRWMGKTETIKFLKFLPVTTNLTYALLLHQDLAIAVNSFWNYF